MHPLWMQLARAAGLELQPPQLGALDHFLDLLLDANRTMNLTRITDRTDAEVLHVGDALTLLPHLPTRPHALADVGSGGGVPGIPLAIARPDVEVLLVEATRKKAEFLRRAAGALELANVGVLAERAETLPRDDGARFDVVTARAVASLEVLARTCLPLLRPGGRLLAMKGARVEEEMAAARRVLGRCAGAALAVHPVVLPGRSRHVIVEIRR